jgi:hypothetical protein
MAHMMRLLCCYISVFRGSEKCREVQKQWYLSDHGTMEATDKEEVRTMESSTEAADIFIDRLAEILLLEIDE